MSIFDEAARLERENVPFALAHIIESHGSTPRHSGQMIVQSDGKIHAPDSLSVYTGGRMHMLYQSNETLGTAIGQLYAKLQEQAADPMKMGAVQGQYSQFNSAQTIISNLHYNDAVQSYQKDVGGFPASVLGKLFGIQEVEFFA